MTRLLVSLALLLIALALSLNLGAAAALLEQPQATATPEPIPDCVPVGKVGVNTLYRCEDPELGNICYWNPLAAGLMDCIEN